MHEVIIVAHCGDNLSNLIKTAMEVVKVKTVSYALIEFNECKVFVQKDSTEESVLEDYMRKLRSA